GEAIERGDVLRDPIREVCRALDRAREAGAAAFAEVGPDAECQGDRRRPGEGQPYLPPKPYRWLRVAGAERGQLAFRGRGTREQFCRARDQRPLLFQACSAGGTLDYMGLDRLRLGRRQLAVQVRVQRSIIHVTCSPFSPASCASTRRLRA